MRKNTVVLDFLKFSIPNKIVFGRTVLSKMSVIALFEKPDMPYATGTEIVNRLETYYMSSRSGDHEQVALMHQAEAEFNDYFRKQGYYVDRVADGDEAIILSSGFHLAKQPIPSDRPEFTAEAGDSPGSIWLKRKAVPGSSSYVWQYYIGAEAPTEDKWLFAGSTTKASFEINGLNSADKAWFRVAAVTKDGMGPFTDPIMKIVP
jgi:hypothetical protein